MSNASSYIRQHFTVQRERGGWFDVRCVVPGHEDKHASASVSAAAGSCLCHGCNAKVAVREIAVERGWPAPPNGHHHGANGACPAKASFPEPTYVYTDADGKPVHGIVRTGTKEFPQLHHDGAGWVWGMKGVGRVLYNLPELLAAQNDGKLAVVVEGEKDVETLREYGWTVTTNPEGAGKWRDGYARHFKSGAEV